MLGNELVMVVNPDPEGDLNDITTLAGLEKSITGMTNDGDPVGSTFAPLMLMSKKQTRNSVKLTWKGISGATGYILYGNQCGKGKKFQRLAELAGNVKTWNMTGLKKGTYHKVTIVAYQFVNGQKKIIGAAKTIHVATKGGKNGNYGKVKPSKKKLSLKVKKSAKIKVTQIKAKGVKKVKKHRKVVYESSNTKVATVDKKGKVKAVKKGKIVIYAYAQNGIFGKVTVTVK